MVVFEIKNLKIIYNTTHPLARILDNLTYLGEFVAFKKPKSAISTLTLHPNRLTSSDNGGQLTLSNYRITSQNQVMILPLTWNNQCGWVISKLVTIYEIQTTHTFMFKHQQGRVWRSVEFNSRFN